MITQAPVELRQFAPMSATTATTRAPRPAALEAATLCEAFQITASERPAEVALRTRDGDWELTWSEYAARTQRLAAGLAALGLERHATCAIMLVNRPEFHLLDNAAMHLGAGPLSLYNTSSPEQILHLLRSAGNRVVVTERQFLERVLPCVAQCPSVEHVVCVDGPADGALTLEDVEAAGDPDFDFDATWRGVQPRDVLTLIYTSGTTGPPKAVQITHANYMSEVNALDPLLHTRAGRMVSYFPMAHIAERNATHNLPRVVGTTVTCCPDPREVFGYLPEVRPTFFFAVPRIWEKLKAALEAGFASELDEDRRAAVAEALARATRRVQAVQAEQSGAGPDSPPPPAADAAILAAIRARIGLDQAGTLLVGAAPTPAEVLVFFHALGLPINEVWGLSETTAVATISPPERIRIGSVGQPLQGLELRLESDGEVLLRGPIVMPGYRDDPQRTAEAIDADGWFHTGDIGRLDSEGYLWIVDRKKELIINAAGKNMSPANIEARIKSASPLIGQAIAIGDRRAYNVALVVLDPDGASQFARDHGLSASSLAELAGDQAVLAEVSAGIDRANSALSRVEQIKRFAVLPEDWLPGGEQLTPTLKLRRKPIAERYAEQIEDLYSH